MDQDDIDVFFFDDRRDLFCGLFGADEGEGQGKSLKACHTCNLVVVALVEGDGMAHAF